MAAQTLTIAQMLPELDSGGVERGTLEMGAFLASQGHRSLVISGGGQLVPDLCRHGSYHITWPHIGEKSPRCLLYLGPLRRLLKQWRVDVLHLRSRLPAWIGYLAWRSLPPRRRPCLVTTFHGFYSVNPYSAIMTKGDKTIAVSTTIARHIQAAYGVPASRIVTIHRGFDERTFDPDAVAASRLAVLRRHWQEPPAGVPLILMPGRLTRLKGHALLFESLAQLKTLPWHLVCVGDTAANPGLTAELTHQLDTLGLSARVTLAGLCNDMPAAFLLADLVVVPSIKPESFGRIAVEAQAMGRPVVASAHGGSLETIEDCRTGWLCKPGDPQALADVIRKALANPEQRKRFGQTGRAWVRERFTTRRMCRQTLAVYRRLLAERGRP